MTKYFLCNAQGLYLSMDGANEMMVKSYHAAYFWNTPDQAECVAKTAKTTGLHVVERTI